MHPSGLDILFSKKSGFRRPLLIAGPCSAESEEQVLETAHALLNNGIALFRSGIWKPRTRPGAFEGVGTLGLKWLQQVKKETGLPVTVEVATARHVELCLKHEIDVLWIGARSTVNPFTVQEIADALLGVNIPVMIKNPVNPDLNLWIGAIERIGNAGVKKIVAIHRGFSSFEKNKYRNKPMWEIPIELKRLFPQLPIICDPSHISGNREWLPSVSQQAMDLNFDGLMIETHPNPERAMSDREQQLTPAALKMLVENLVIREISPDNLVLKATLEELREIVDRYDEELVRALKERLEVIHQIGIFKKENSISILQPERWNEIVNTRTEWARKFGISEELMLHIFQLIHQESIVKQTEILNAQSSIIEQHSEDKF